MGIFFSQREVIKTNNTQHSKQKANNMVIWFVLGPIGAGKSTFIANSIKGTNLVFLSSDNLKRETNLPYPQVRLMMEKVLEQHVKDRISFVTEGTGQHDDLYDLFLNYKKDPGIELKVTYIDVPLDIALYRNKNRTRVLDDSTVIEVHKRCAERKDKWKEFNCTYIDYKDLLNKQSVDFSQVY